MKLENTGKALPILSFPCTSLMGVKTDELVHSAELQAKGMKAVADRTDAAASVSMMGGVLPGLSELHRLLGMRHPSACSVGESRRVLRGGE